MSIPSKCPQCDQPVRVPDGLSEQARVRCPMCSAEFSAGEALAGAPPLVIVLDLGPAPGEPSGAATAAETSQWATPAAAAAAGLGSDVAATEGGQETGQAAGPALDGESLPDLWRKVDEAPQIDLGEGAAAHETEAVDSAAFAAFGAEQEPAEDQSAVDRLLSARRPPGKRREKSLARELLGAVIGGFLGLALGYYVLNFFGGERFDKLPIPLPGVPHTYEHWPFGHAAPGSPQEQTSPSGRPAAHQPSPPGPAGSAARGSPNTAGSGGLAPSPPLSTIPPASTPPSSTSPAGAQLPGGTGDAGSLPASPITGPEGGGPGAQAPGNSAGGEGNSPQPDPATPPKLGLIDAPIYTAEDLNGALNKAQTLFGCWMCNSTGTVTRAGQTVTCPRCKGTPNLELSPEAYDAFCRVAETVTFLSDDGHRPLIDQRRATETLLEWIARAPGQLDLAARFAIGNLQTADDRLQGILMAGTAGPQSEQNGLYGTMVQMSGIPSSYLVLSDRPMPFQPADQVVILGVAVPEPARRVRGYSGSKPVAVWLGAAVKVAP